MNCPNCSTIHFWSGLSLNLGQKFKFEPFWTKTYLTCDQKFRSKIERTKAAFSKWIKNVTWPPSNTLPHQKLRPRVSHKHVIIGKIIKTRFQKLWRHNDQVLIMNASLFVKSHEMEEILFGVPVFRKRILSVGNFSNFELGSKNGT